MQTDDPKKPPAGPEMLASYRETTTPEFKVQVEAFKRMSLAERDELLFYMCSYMANQYAQLLAALRPPMPPMGRAN